MLTRSYNRLSVTANADLVVLCTDDSSKSNPKISHSFPGALGHVPSEDRPVDRRGHGEGSELSDPRSNCGAGALIEEFL